MTSTLTAPPTGTTSRLSRLGPMPDLTTVDGVIQYLEGTIYAAREVELLNGGGSAYTYRVRFRNPLPDGATSLVLKHSEDFPVAMKTTSVGVERATFEYEALTMLASSGLYDSNSRVQVPNIIHFDCDTHTIFMRDLGSVKSLSMVLREAVHNCELSGTPAREQYVNISSQFGEALGDFLGRFHDWSALPEQASLRQHFLGNLASVGQAIPVRYDGMLRMVEKSGRRETWMDDLAQKGKQDALKGGDVIAMGDFFLGNMLVSATAPHNDPRVHVVDWELTKCARPETDVGEFAAISYLLARVHGFQDEDPLASAFQQAYTRHRAVDPIQVGLSAGMNVIQLAHWLPWVKAADDDVVDDVVNFGVRLLELVYREDAESLRKTSLLHHLF